MHPQDQGVPPVDPDQKAFVPFGIQTGVTPLDPRAAGHSFHLPRPLFRQRELSTKGQSRPFGTTTKDAYALGARVSLALTPAKGIALGTACIRT